MKQENKRTLFLIVKDFMKKNMNGPYSFIRYWILQFAHTYRRQYKLRLSLMRNPLFKFNYRNVSFLISLDPKNGYIDEKICDVGVFESEMLDAFMVYVKEGMTFVDIGANIGQHSLFVSRLVGENGNVISFEPIPRLYQQFKRSVEANNMKNVNIINAGCGNKEETLDIYMDKSNMGASSVIKPDTRSKLTKTSIHIIKPEEILLSYKKIDVMKIDVEGFEYNVLTGLEKVIERDKPIIFLEYSPSFYVKSKNHDTEHDGISLLSLLQKYKYSLKDLDGRFPSESENLTAWGKNFDEKTKDISHRQVNLIFSTTN